MELCGKTYEKTHTVRLHAHVALRASRRMSWYARSAADLTFLDGMFHVQSDECLTSRRKIGWQSFYYVAAPKTSQLFTYNTKEPFIDYLVNANWIWNLVQGEKLTPSVARQQFVRCGNRLTTHLPNIERVLSEPIALELKNKIAEKERIFQAERHPFKPILPVQRLVVDLQTPRDRRKFLVVEGPSRLGKTQYIMSLFGRTATLEINAADEMSPSLQAFDYKEHRCILLDEASPEMVLRNRKVFQAPNAMVELGQSKTNCHSYSCYLNETLLCIASNSWSVAVDACPAASRDWIKANQVLIKITHPLWREA